MKMKFEQARALYGSDEQMARALFDEVVILRIDVRLQMALRRRTEDLLQQGATSNEKDSQQGGIKKMNKPAIEIAPTIRTWRERIGANENFPLHVPTDVETAMVAEIAELRAALPQSCALAAELVKGGV